MTDNPSLIPRQEYPQTPFIDGVVQLYHSYILGEIEIAFRCPMAKRFDTYAAAARKYEEPARLAGLGLPPGMPLDELSGLQTAVQEAFLQFFSPVVAQLGFEWNKELDKKCMAYSLGVNACCRAIPIRSSSYAPEFNVCNLSSLDRTAMLTLTFWDQTGCMEPYQRIVETLWDEYPGFKETKVQALNLDGSPAFSEDGRPKMVTTFLTLDTAFVRRRDETRHGFRIAPLSKVIEVLERARAVV